MKKLSNILLAFLLVPLILIGSAHADRQDICDAAECYVNGNIHVKGTAQFDGPGNGSFLKVQTATTTLSAMSGATVSATNLIPAGSIVLGVNTSVNTLITASGGGANFTIGDGTTADRWGSAVVFAAGTTTGIANYKAATALLQAYAAATSVVLTVNTGAFTAGAVRVTVYYIVVSGPNS